jgi:hypothetical protein
MSIAKLEHTCGNIHIEMFEDRVTMRKPWLMGEASEMELFARIYVGILTPGETGRSGGTR